MKTKECTKCGDPKPGSAFPKNASKPDGRDGECKRCKREREGTPVARAAKRWRDLLRKYGVSREAYNKLMVKQGGLCCICNKPERRTNQLGELLPLAVDHDHETGELRGLLCATCNKALGLFEDDGHIIQAAGLYLQGWRRSANGWLYEG
jgi:hypothetical protein